MRTSTERQATTIAFGDLPGDGQAEAMAGMALQTAEPAELRAGQAVFGAIGKSQALATLIKLTPTGLQAALTNMNPG